MTNQITGAVRIFKSLLDEGLRALGATVFPAGVGNTEVQAEAIEILKAKVYVGTPDFLQAILDKAKETNRDLSSLNTALVSGGALFPSMREAYKEQGIRVSQSYATADIGSIAIDNFGDPFPKETENACLESDAILLGAIGDPKYDNNPKATVRPEQGLLKMRKTLGLFSNIRPIRVQPKLSHLSPVKEDRLKDVDFVIFRELTGGIYFGEKKKEKDSASDLCLYTRKVIKRVAKLAYEMAQQRNSKLTLVDKANVLESSRLWRETVQAMEKDYPEVKVTYEFVDAVAMRLVQWPNSYDVMITANLFGDILTDEASVISGSMGLMPSASVGEKTKLYEPIHGSYPQAAGKDIANPLATVLSAAMMFEDFGLAQEAQEIRDVVNKSLAEGYVTEDLAEGGTSYKTSEVGDWLVANI